MNERFKFFGSFLDPLTMDQTLDKIDEIILKRERVQHVVINVAKLALMQKNESLRRIVNACRIINADGQGIVWGARLLGYKVPERVAGIDLFMNLVARAAERHYRVYFFGAEQESVEKMVQRFKTDHAHLDVAGYRNGYYKPEEEPLIADQIRRSGADLLFVAMGSPQKELFLARYLEVMQVPFVMGVGGSFDVVAGKTFRAPMWMRKVGLEWLYRLSNEPRRMFWRYLSTNTIYLGMLIKAMLFGKTRYGCD